jgi:hypothetical protein
MAARTPATPAIGMQLESDGPGRSAARCWRSVIGDWRDDWDMLRALQGRLEEIYRSRAGGSVEAADSEPFRTPVPIESVHRFRRFRTPAEEKLVAAGAR